jgi:hypothetical protein
MFDCLFQLCFIDCSTCDLILVADDFMATFSQLDRAAAMVLNDDDVPKSSSDDVNTPAEQVNSETSEHDDESDTDDDEDDDDNDDLKEDTSIDHLITNSKYFA